MIQADINGVPIGFGRQRCLVAFLTNVTEHIRLVAAEEGLEVQIRQAQKLAAIGNLADGVPHDLDDLLTGIKGHAELMLTDPGLDLRPEEDVTDTLALADQAANLTRRSLSAGSRT